MQAGKQKSPSVFQRAGGNPEILSGLHLNLVAGEALDFYLFADSGDFLREQLFDCELVVLDKRLFEQGDAAMNLSIFPRPQSSA